MCIAIFIGLLWLLRLPPLFMRLTEEKGNIYDGYPMVTVVTKEIVYTTDQDQHLARGANNQLVR